MQRRTAMAEQSNGYASAQRWVSEIEKHQDSVQDVMMRAMRDCQPYHEFIREAKAAAKGEGISVKLLNAALKERKLQRAIVKNRADMDEEIAEDFEAMIEALAPVAGLPLFAVAAADLEAKAEARKAKKAARSADIDALSDVPMPDIVGSNVTALRAGIQQLG
jgi:hypothetical protein